MQHTEPGAKRKTESGLAKAIARSAAFTRDRLKAELQTLYKSLPGGSASRRLSST